MRALAVKLGWSAMPLLPDTPSFGEISPGFFVGTILGLAAPARTPRPIVERLNREIAKVVNTDAMRERLRTHGQQGQGAARRRNSPQTVAQYVDALDRRDRTSSGLRADRLPYRADRTSGGLTALRHSSSTPSAGPSKPQKSAAKEPFDGPEFRAQPPGAISCKFRGRRRCPTASCGRWTRRSSTIAARSSPSSPSARSKASRRSSRPPTRSIIYTATGTGAWEGALVNTLSPGDRVLMVETGQFATLWKKMAEQHRPQAGVHHHRLAQRRRSEGDRSQAPRRQEQGDQGGLRSAQRDLDRRADADRGDPQGDRRRRPSGAVHGRHHLVARLGRLPPRRMGRRRLGRRRAEGPDAAARHVVQRHQRQGDRRPTRTRRCRSRSSPGTTC